MTTAHICPKCGARMIKRRRPWAYASYPAQYDWYWWCACGMEEPGGREFEQTDEQVAFRDWEEEQKR